MENQPLEEKLGEKVDKILATNTVTKAQSLLSSRRGMWLIAVVSFVESATPVPVITDPFMMAAILINRTAYLKIILLTTATSVLGGIVAYYTAYYFIDVLLSIFPPHTSFEIARAAANAEQNIFVLTLIGAFTPVPYTLTAWAIGVLQGGLLPFIAASVLGRGGRYLIAGWLTYQFGPRAVARARRSIGITSVIIVALAAIFFWYKM